MHTPILSKLAAAIAVAALATPAAIAQDLVLVVDRDTGGLSITGSDATDVAFRGYEIEFTNPNPSGVFVQGNFNGLGDTEGADWQQVGATNGLSDSLLAEINGNLNLSGNDPNAIATANSGVSFDLGSGVYDPAQAILDAGFGVDIEPNVAFRYAPPGEPLTFVLQTGTVRFEGEQIFNNIGITVDLADGTAIIENESPFDQTITGFLIEAATADTLNESGTFTGVGAAFESNVADGENLGQVDPTGAGIALNAGQSINLGVVGGTFNDLSFSFLLEGVGEETRTGFVKYLNVPPPGVAGDFNGDSLVNAADYVVLRDNSSDVIADYNVWATNFGAGTAGSALAASSPVPEPSALLLVAIPVLLGAVRRSV